MVKIKSINFQAKNLNNIRFFFLHKELIKQCYYEIFGYKKVFKKLRIQQLNIDGIIEQECSNSEFASCNKSWIN